MSYKSSRQRPISITLICILYFVLLPSLILFTFLPAIQQKLSSTAILLADCYFAFLLIVSVGLWKKKWAAYTYLSLQDLSLSYCLFLGELNFSLTQILIIFFVFNNISRMT